MPVGMPQSLWLQQFGDHLYRAFGEVAYHVGSSLREKSGWRDVDVRVMLSDEEYARIELGDPDRPHDNQRWVSIVLAWSAFGHQLTGLPIDFQLQQRTYANEKFGRPDHQRSALILICDAHANSALWDRARQSVLEERKREH